MNSCLWFINSPKLEERILAYLARYQELYQIELYAFILMGNHYHLLGRFPLMNKAAFFKSFNAIVAKLVQAHVREFVGGKLWARRVRVQSVPLDADIENQFYYCALNPVSSGLCRNLGNFKSYNSFSDAISNRKRKFKVINWERFNNLKRRNSSITLGDCETEHTLTYSRLPGFEHLSSSHYAREMLKRLEIRKEGVVAKRLSDGKGFASVESLKKQPPGVRPHTTKKSARETHRPLVLTSCQKARDAFMDFYFGMLSAYKVASRKFRSGNLRVEFPNGTYLPTRLVLLFR